MIEYQLCFYKTSLHLTSVLRQTIVMLHASYLIILHCDYWLMVLNKLLSHLKRFFLFDSVIWTNSETCIFFVVEIILFKSDLFLDVINVWCVMCLFIWTLLLFHQTYQKQWLGSWFLLLVFYLPMSRRFYFAQRWEKLQGYSVYHSPVWTLCIA